jgi:hypothetical protein
MHDAGSTCRCEVPQYHQPQQPLIHILLSTHMAADVIPALYVGEDDWVQSPEERTQTNVLYCTALTICTAPYAVCPVQAKYHQPQVLGNAAPGPIPLLWLMEALHPSAATSGRSLYDHAALLLAATPTLCDHHASP